MTDLAERMLVRDLVSDPMNTNKRLRVLRALVRSSDPVELRALYVPRMKSLRGYIELRHPRILPFFDMWEMYLLNRHAQREFLRAVAYELGRGQLWEKGRFWERHPTRDWRHDSESDLEGKAKGAMAVIRKWGRNLDPTR